MPRYGAIYIAHNPRDGAETYKVGKTERSFPERMAELTADTSNIGTYTAKAVFVVADVDAAEKACHDRLKRYRVQPNREFFNLTLDRLVEAVTEAARPYFAGNLIPDLAKSEPSPSSTQSTLEKIETLKQNRADAEDQFEEAVQNAEIELEQSFEVIHEKLLSMRNELSDLDFLTWDIPSTFQAAKAKYGRRTFCSVMFHSKFSGEPLVLRASGIRVSRMVEGPTKVNSSISDDEFEFVEWKEVDDGRYGRVEIASGIDKYRSDSGAGSVKLVIHVRAVRITYDDYRCNWNDTRTEKRFTNLEEALEIFEELVVTNTARHEFLDAYAHDRGTEFFKVDILRD